MKPAPERYGDELSSFQAFEEIVFADGSSRIERRAGSRAGNSTAPLTTNG
jgi:hypothetical protein